MAELSGVMGDDSPIGRQLATNAIRHSRLQNAEFPKPRHQRVFAMTNQKGGVGKTTSTVNLAAALAQGGLSVLVIDLDPQGNASTALGLVDRSELISVYDVLLGECDLSQAVLQHSEISGLDIVPSSINLAGAEIELVTTDAREYHLKHALDSLSKVYDYVFIDCPPSLGILTINAFLAATEVCIPIQCEYYALEGLSQLLGSINLVKQGLNPALDMSTILLTMYDGRTNLSAQVAQEVRAHFPEQTLATEIPRSVRVSEAPSYGQTVLEYDPKSSAALSYNEAAEEIAKRGA